MKRSSAVPRGGILSVTAFPAKLPRDGSPRFHRGHSVPQVARGDKEPGLRAMILTVYRLGFRLSEFKNVLVLQVAGGWISLWAGATKNSKARTLAMPPCIREAVEACCVGKQPDAHLFTWPSGGPILDFWTAWANAGKAAGVSGLASTIYVGVQPGI